MDTSGSVSELSNAPPLPAEFWKIFHTSVPALFNNDDDIIQKLGIIIEKCRVHYEYYVPPILGQRAEYETKLSHYIAFTSWLLGQLVRATTIDKLECYHFMFEEWQISILDLLAKRNQNMFVVIIMEYLAAIKDVVEARSKFLDNPEKAVTFEWFGQASHHQVASQPLLEAFHIENSRRCAAVLSHLLRIVSSQTYMLFKCVPNMGASYWHCLLSALEDSHTQVVVAALDSITSNIHSSGCPYQTIITSKMCTVLDGIVSILTNNNSGNCDSNESLKPVLISLSALFRAFLANNGTGSETNDIRLFQTLVTLLDIKNPFLYSGCTSKDYCKLLAFFQRFGRSVNLKDKIQPLIVSASYFPAILLVIEPVVLGEIEKMFNKDKEEIIRVPVISSVWSCVLTAVSQTLEALKTEENIDSVRLQRAVKFITATFRTAAIISHNLSNSHNKDVPIVLFGDAFYKMFNKVLLELDLTKIYHEISKASKYLISLQEISLIDTDEVNKLVSFLSVPWLKQMSSDQLMRINMAPYIELANLHMFSDDSSVQCDCLEGLVLCGPVALDWRLALLEVARGHADTALTMLRLLPVLVSIVPPDMKKTVVNRLVLPYFTLNISTQFSKVLPSVVCALASTTQLTRNLSDEMFVKCEICDGEEDPVFINGSLEESALSLLELYLNLCTHDSAEIRADVAMSLNNWSKHIKGERLRPLLPRWLVLLSDEASEVRVQLSRVAGPLVAGGVVPELLQQFTQAAWTVALRSLQSADRDLQLSVMATVYNISCLPCDNVAWPTLKIFILFLGHPSTLNPSVAQIYLKKIAALGNKTIQDIFFRFQDEIFKVVSTLLFHNQMFNSKCVPMTLLNLSRGLGFHNSKELLDSSARKYLLKYLLPLVVKKPNSVELISAIAATLNTSVSVLLKNSFQYVYPHVILFADKVTLDSVCKLIEQHTEHTLQSLICLSFKVITCELLLQFHQERPKVTDALLELRKFETEIPMEIKKRSSPQTDIEIAEFIQPRFLAVLAYLDSILVSRSGCESTKRLALLTLPDLIRLMGADHVTPVRFKVLATLRSALNLYHSYFPELICFAWRAFVLNVSTLGPLLSTIFVSLLPLLDQYPVEITSVFHILVVDNLELVRGHLAELHFLPDTPVTHEIYTLVQQQLDHLRTLPMKDQLEVTLRLAIHENADVRLRGLNKLRDELSQNRQQLMRLITGHDNMDPFMLKLLEALIAGCRDADEGVRLASAQCLGEVGALDPGLLPNKIKMEEKQEMLCVVNSDDFVMRALNEFVRAFHAANHTTTMDSFAFGIQELLKIYKVATSDIWNQLSDSTKEIISPFRESRYRDLATDSEGQALIPHPIFGTMHGATFKSWTINWVCRLIPTVTDEFVRKVFSVCQLGLKKDLQTLLFFFPYIVLYAILGATKSQSKRIAEEISAVLFWSDEQTMSRDGDATPRSVLTSSSEQDLPSTPEESITHTLCAKTVYQLVDFLYRWMRQAKEKIKPKEETELASQYQKLNDFLKSFSKLEIAEGSYRCKEYTRALLFLEEYMAEKPNDVQSYLPYLGKIYYQLHDPDSIKGVIAIQEAEPSAQEMILYHEVTGKLQDAAACYERLGQEQAPSEDLYRAMVQCYLGMDQPSTALNLANGFLNNMNKSQQSQELLDEQAEAMLSLSMFPQLEQLLSGRGVGVGLGAGWGTSLAQALLHLSKRQAPQLVAGLDTVRQTLVRSLATAGCSVSHSGYRHAYDVIVKLHIVAEVEKLGKMVLQMFECKSKDQMEGLFRAVVHEELDERLKLVQPSWRVLQSVLCVRRVVLSLAHQLFTQSHPAIATLFSGEIGNTWLKSIEIARKSGHYQQAYTNILTVEPYKPKGLFVEKAKLLWAKSEPEAALNTLKRGIEHHFSDIAEFKNLSANERTDDRRLCAEAKLLVAIYNDENVNIDMETNLSNYTSAVEVCRNWEKSIVCLAHYKYKYLRTFCENPEMRAKTLESQVYIINYFGKSLQYGCEYIYQSMPRMLSIWLDFGTQLAQATPSGRDSATAERRAAMDKMTTLIGTYIERLPTYMFMTAFSQLISRICHPHKDCYKLLRAIIIKIIIAYPQQALWMFLSVYKSPYSVRVRRCEEVLRSNEIQKEGELCRTINDFRNLVERLIDMCNKPVANTRGTVTTSMKTFLNPLYRLVSSPAFSKVLIPLQKFRTISLPRSTTKFHNPFPEDMVFIAGMKEEIIILPSLQKPRKITFIGTDGKQYPMMCKPNDDLRLDSRMMEFNSIVNMYLQRDPEARDRGLHIRTYSAVPLSDTSGLIEWVPNLIGLRLVINKAYKQMGIQMSSKEYKEICCARGDPLSKKRQVFLEKFLPRHPAVLREWFLREFSHPTTWYLARSGFVRTLAVMSIVGFMLGLGDRHGENILLDAICGDVVHVDFNCLFNKGERFDWPERVPFRLTHNLVNAMGPTGVEGVFRHSSEITTRVMRQQIDQLMSVVRPFCYDPLVSWNTDKNARDENAEMTNEKALEDIQNIESRLQGIVRTRNRVHSIPLSVEGQVRTLIAEATNVDNLCQMYIGWGPYL